MPHAARHLWGSPVASACQQSLGYALSPAPGEARPVVFIP
jgi:hypothetical protein